MTVKQANVSFFCAIVVIFLCFYGLAKFDETLLPAFNAAGVVTAILLAIYLNKISEITAKNEISLNLIRNQQETRHLISSELEATARNADQFIHRLLLVTNESSPNGVTFNFRNKRIFFNSVIKYMGKLPPDYLQVIIKEETLLLSCLKDEFILDAPIDNDERSNLIFDFEDIIGRCAIYLTRLNFPV